MYKRQKDYKTPIERFTNISTWALDIIHKHKTDTAKVFIEGYSFGSKGQAVFQIAENCGILKYSCLLYTSDAADEEDSVDLGGRRIIKQKNNNVVQI